MALPCNSVGVSIRSVHLGKDLVYTLLLGWWGWMMERENFVLGPPTIDIVRIYSRYSRAKNHLGEGFSNRPHPSLSNSKTWIEYVVVVGLRDSFMSVFKCFAFGPHLPPSIKPQPASVSTHFISPCMKSIYHLSPPPTIFLLLLRLLRKQLGEFVNIWPLICRIGQWYLLRLSQK